METEHLQAIIPDALAGKRLDQVLATLFHQYSRNRLQAWIKDGQVTVNGVSLSAKNKMVGGEQVEIFATLEIQQVCQPQALPLNVVYEDDSVIVINKPAGLVVHPGAGNPDGTLQNALLNYDERLDKVPRAGIVHRLDKDTSGLLVVARTLASHTSLVRQLQNRSVKREYDTIVNGHILTGGVIDRPIGRHPTNRTRMAVREDGKEAITHYTIQQHFQNYTWLKVSLETGRTHQIRVHLSSMHYALVGDSVYAGRMKLPPAISEQLKQYLLAFPRQALHASALALYHPENDQLCHWTIPLADDMQQLLWQLMDGNKLVR